MDEKNLLIVEQHNCINGLDLNRYITNISFQEVYNLFKMDIYWYYLFLDSTTLKRSLKC